MVTGRTEFSPTGMRQHIYQDDACKSPLLMQVRISQQISSQESKITLTLTLFAYNARYDTQNDVLAIT